MKSKVGSGILLLMVGVGIYGVFDNHIASSFGISVALWTSTLLSASLVIYLIASSMNPDSHYREKLWERGKSPFWETLKAILVLPIFIFMLLFMGLPSILTQLFGNEGVLELTSSKKLASYNSTRCKGGVYLREYNSFLNNKLCGIQRPDWETIERGQKIQVFGKVSKFGFSSTRYLLLQKTEK